MNLGAINKIDEDVYLPIQSYGVCKRKTCANYKWGVEDYLANGYCTPCWDKGYGFKRGDVQLGYRFRQEYVFDE